MKSVDEGESLRRTASESGSSLCCKLPIVSVWKFVALRPRLRPPVQTIGRIPPEDEGESIPGAGTESGSRSRCKPPMTPEWDSVASRPRPRPPFKLSAELSRRMKENNPRRGSFPFAPGPFPAARQMAVGLGPPFCSERTVCWRQIRFKFSPQSADVFSVEIVRVATSPRPPYRVSAELGRRMEENPGWRRDYCQSLRLNLADTQSLRDRRPKVAVGVSRRSHRHHFTEGIPQAGCSWWLAASLPQVLAVNCR
jgi:hypothetical protein